MERTVISTSGIETIGIHMPKKKKKTTTLIPDTNINSK